MNTKRCLIVDDEPLAIATLRRMLAGHQEIEVVGEAHSVASARAACVVHLPDLILLDVKLGDGSGFDLLAALEEPPAVIFTTAYDQHAVKAFEVNALDYLLKPIEETRLAEALERAKRRSAGGAITRVVSGGGLPGEGELIEVGCTGRFIEPRTIAYIRAEDKYTRVQLGDSSEILTQISLTEWQQRLERFDFLRVDRQWLIRRGAMRNVEFLGREAHVDIQGLNLRIKFGRTGSSRLRQILRGVSA
jgi:two-component system LytT family response regulator